MPYFSMLLTHYCHQLGKKCVLKAVVSVSMCWDPAITKESLLANFTFNRALYITHLTSNQRDVIIKRYMHAVFAKVMVN